MTRRFILASGSGARLRLLRAAGFDPEVVISGVDEDGVDGLDATPTVLALAELKAAAVAARPEAADAIVLGCDSLFEFDGEVFGKPADAAAAVARWRRMRGSEGTLFTGHCVIDTRTDAAVSAVGAAVVRFGSPSDAEIAAYVATGEPLEVAGGFTIDGRAAAFIDGVDGDPSNVIGVSLPVLRTLLVKLDVDVTSLWR